MDSWALLPWTLIVDTKENSRYHSPTGSSWYWISNLQSLIAQASFCQVPGGGILKKDDIGFLPCGHYYLPKEVSPLYPWMWDDFRASALCISQQKTSLLQSLGGHSQDGASHPRPHIFSLGRLLSGPPVPSSPPACLPSPLWPSLLFSMPVGTLLSLPSPLDYYSLLIHFYFGGKKAIYLV